MRVIALFICLALFGSVIHATQSGAVSTGSPVSLASAHSSLQPVLQDNHDHCVDGQSVKPADHQGTCQLHPDLCCLGLAIFHTPARLASLPSSRGVNPTARTVLLSTTQEAIYKPPKSALRG